VRRFLRLTPAVAAAGIAVLLPDAGREQPPWSRPWPVLLEAPASADLRTAMLQRRADAMLERLTRSTRPVNLAGDLQAFLNDKP